MELALGKAVGDKNAMLTCPLTLIDHLFFGPTNLLGEGGGRAIPVDGFGYFIEEPNIILRC